MTKLAAELADDEIVSTVIVLLNAGHEATVNTTGNGMTALLRHPDQWARVTSQEVAARQAVEEVIRWDPPLQLPGRGARRGWSPASGGKGVTLVARRRVTGADVAAEAGVSVSIGVVQSPPRRLGSAAGW
ncbi:cytochrome P450 [Streptomyces sp. NPDC001292]|uniref:cytochrome P450 n=1 Tax=Streptomyces sp. NPDC001292 TaxID=3364558 RepID=UPI00369CC76E